MRGLFGCEQNVVHWRPMSEPKTWPACVFHKSRHTSRPHLRGQHALGAHDDIAEAHLPNHVWALMSLAHASCNTPRGVSCMKPPIFTLGSNPSCPCAAQAG